MILSESGRNDCCLNAHTKHKSTKGCIAMKNQTIIPPRRIMILSSGSVAGKKEKQGPLGNQFDIAGDDRFGKDSWEKAEAEMQRLALGLALSKSMLREDDIDAMFAGDLINQCISSSYGLLSYRIPFLGLFGACSTCAEGLLLSALSAVLTSFLLC